jgi:lysophospholipase L1-like esterase
MFSARGVRGGALALAFCLCACGAPPGVPLPAGATVLVVGNSITAGYGLDPTSAWPARLSELTGWRVVAAGVSGDTTAGGRARLPALLDEHAPALVVIELGGNDLLRRVPDATIAGNLDEMIRLARARGARLALVAAPKPTALGAVAGLSPAGVYREVARRNGIPLAEEALAGVLSDERLRQDPLHPNAAGHDALARRVADELRAAGLVAGS